MHLNEFLGSDFSYPVVSLISSNTGHIVPIFINNETGFMPFALPCSHFSPLILKF